MHTKEPLCPTALFPQEKTSLLSKSAQSERQARIYFVGCLPADFFLLQNSEKQDGLALFLGKDTTLTIDTFTQGILIDDYLISMIKPEE